MAVLRKMVRDLNMDVEVVVWPIVREADDAFESRIQGRARIEQSGVSGRVPGRMAWELKLAREFLCELDYGLAAVVAGFFAT